MLSHSACSAPSINDILPREVLAMILELSPLYESPDGGASAKKLDRRRFFYWWRAVTSTCKLWRRLLLDSRRMELLMGRFGLAPQVNIINGYNAPNELPLSPGVTLMLTWDRQESVHHPKAPFFLGPRYDFNTYPVMAGLRHVGPRAVETVTFTKPGHRATMFRVAKKTFGMSFTTAGKLYGGFRRQKGRQADAQRWVCYAELSPGHHAVRKAQRSAPMMREWARAMRQIASRNLPEWFLTEQSNQRALELFQLTEHQDKLASLH